MGIFRSARNSAWVIYGLVTATPWAARPAAADVRIGPELGAWLGGHGFARDNELGVYERAPGHTTPDLRGSLVMGARLGWRPWWFVGAEVEAAMAWASAANSDPLIGAASVDATVLLYRAHVLGYFLKRATQVEPFWVVGIGAQAITSSSDERVIEPDHDFTAHAGLGARARLGRAFGVRVDTRLIIPPSINGSGPELGVVDWEMTLGLWVSWPLRDRLATRTPRTVAPDKPAALPVLAPPVRPAVIDGDGDGFEGQADACPTLAEDVDGDRDSDGCPDADRDSDGIDDQIDKCPDAAETRNAFEDEDGCPDEPAGPAPGATPAVGLSPAATHLGSEGATGSASPPPGPAPHLPSKANAPTGQGVAVPELPRVIFAKGSSALSAADQKALVRVVTYLAAAPTVRLEVGGHTDASGQDAENATLAQDRADVVARYLLAQGVAPERLVVVSYGATQPIGDNKHTAGRRLNRRVVFLRLP